MEDYMFIGSVPYKEPCAQVGSEGYDLLGKFECNLFMNAIVNLLGKPPKEAKLTVKSNPHDFGVYYTVVCHFDKEIEESLDYALKCEGINIPKWSGEEKKLLIEYKQIIKIPNRKTWPSVMNITVGDLLEHKSQ